MLTAEGFSPERMALVMPKIFVEEFEVLPLRVAGSRILYLGSASRLNASAALGLEQMSELKVESEGSWREQIYESARDRLFACEEESKRSWRWWMIRMRWRRG